jgi:hypothetical protein
VPKKVRTGDLWIGLASIANDNGITMIPHNRPIQKSYGFGIDERGVSSSTARVFRDLVKTGLVRFRVRMTAAIFADAATATHPKNATGTNAPKPATA